MYTLEVRRRFVAQHYLVGGDFGLENERHSHCYELHLEMNGSHLDEFGYLVDIVDVERVLDQVVDRFRDQTLNETPEFRDLNPSIEHFSRIIWENLQRELPIERLQRLIVRLWENESAGAGYEAPI